MARDLTNTRIRDFIKRLKMRIILTDSIGKQVYILVVLSKFIVWEMLISVVFVLP